MLYLARGQPLPECFALLCNYAGISTEAFLQVRRFERLWR
ncbi:hypothetical protein AB395_00001715 [Sinorhizobium fredii CCBAU 45436]|nr:hypothetical protein AB395_00001715 [Sinorhizobium fredii CCBAU 45436]AWM25227.1 hypothetical protein AOX55_00001975 [Sinorhizobium fredii CCBAU 25509]